MHGSFNDVLHGLTKFSGDDKTYSSTKWAQDLEDNAEIFGWNAQQKLIIARRTLTGTAELWLRSEKVFRTYEELKSALQREFPDQVNCKEMHEIMSNRKKLKEETYYQYLLVMKELGKRAKFPDYVAIQYIIDGINDYEMNKSMLYGVTSYSVLKEKLQIYEKIKSKKPILEKKISNSKNDANFSFRRCYKCGEKDHISNACKNGVKCFRCNEYGHVGINCKRMQSNQAYEDRKTSSNPATTSKMSDRSNVNMTLTAHNSDLSDSSTKRILEIETQNSKKNAMKSVLICDKRFTALIDTGSDVNLLSEKCLSNTHVKIEHESLLLFGLGKSEIHSIGKLNTSVIIDGQCFRDVNFHVVSSDSMPYDVLLGQEFLQSITMIMDDGRITLLPDGLDDWMSKIGCLSGCVNFVLGHMSNPAVKEDVLKCVESYVPIQTKEAPLQLKIVLKDEIPVSQRPRRLSLAEQKIVEQQISEWLENNIIQVSYSEYSSPLVLVKKKDGSTRVCVDYRLLNSKIVKDEYPLPVMEDLIDKLVNAKVYSVLDLKNGFFHMRVSEESIPYTSFVTHEGQYEFLRAPFGLSICPKYFTRFITIIFRELIAQGIIVVFIDDILILAEDETQAAQRLKQVLDAASQYGLQINWKKANLICREIEFLGHNIKAGEIRPSVEKTDAVVRYPEPRTMKQLHSFIGLTSYFRKYIQDYAVIAKPLTDVLKTKIFKFNVEHKKAFNDLKMKLALPPVLKIYNPKLRTELHTDASAVALSAILMQHHESGLHPVHYMSKKTTDDQSKCSSYELEALAIIEGVKKFRHYLYGIEFKIVTDCQAFELTLRKKDLSPKVARWVMFLNEYNFKVEHRSGSKMAHADALSRYPCVAVVTSLHDDIRKAQDNDDGLKAIKEISKNKTYHDYWIENNILYKGEDKKLVIPKVMEKEIIQRIHSNGHFTKKKMKELISKDFYIKDVDKKIDEFITGCIPCLLATRKAGKQEGFLCPIEKDSIPLDTIHIDHIGPLTETKKQYNYILTMIDAFTKFVWLFPTKTTSSSETLNKLKLHQQAFGNPRRIISDRGTAFTSHEFQTYCEEENIQHIKITTGVPRGNGQVERIHRIMIPTLTKLCIENQGVWYKYVSRLQRCLNSTFQRSINTTPFELMIGTKMKCKEDLEIIDLLQQEIIDNYNENRENQRKLAKEQILRIQEENQRNYNKKRKESTKYELGDIVAIKRTQYGPGLKLKPKYLGPYKITKIKRNDRYDVEKIDNSVEGPNRTASSVDQMKRWPACEETFSVY